MGDRYPIDGSRDALWMATAVAPPETEVLTGELKVDVAVIGGGFTGLNAALHLAEKGTSVAVLEGADLGFGASGRSGGQVNLGLNLGPKALIDLYGPGPGERLVEAVAKTPDDIFDLIRRHQLDCDPVQNGWVQGAVTGDQLKAQEKLAEDYAAFGVTFECLDRKGILERSGAHGFEGGLFCPPAGSLHPLSYTRELARVAMKLGARIFTKAKVQSLKKEGQNWLLTTAGGRALASTVLVCTNAYSDDLIDGLKEKVVPVRSLLMATEPLSRDLRKTIMPGRSPSSINAA